jgi:hypothetical protein
MDKKKTRVFRKTAREGRIVFAEQDRIAAIPRALVDEFLAKIFEVEGALVTDESQLSDFASYDDGRDEEITAACIRVREIYGIACKRDEYLWAVLERIRAR